MPMTFSIWKGALALLLASFWLFTFVLPLQMLIQISLCATVGILELSHLAVLSPYLRMCNTIVICMCLHTMIGDSFR